MLPNHKALRGRESVTSAQRGRFELLKGVQLHSKTSFLSAVFSQRRRYGTANVWTISLTKRRFASSSDQRK